MAAIADPLRLKTSQQWLGCSEQTAAESPTHMVLFWYEDNH